ADGSDGAADPSPPPAPPPSEPESALVGSATGAEGPSPPSVMPRTISPATTTATQSAIHCSERRFPCCSAAIPTPASQAHDMSSRQRRMGADLTQTCPVDTCLRTHDGLAGIASDRCAPSSRTSSTTPSSPERCTESL